MYRPEWVKGTLQEQATQEDRQSRIEIDIDVAVPEFTYPSKETLEKLHPTYNGGNDLMRVIADIQSGQPIWCPREFRSSLPKRDGSISYYDYYQHRLPQGAIGVFPEEGKFQAIAYSFLTNTLLGKPYLPVNTAVELVEEHTNKHYIRRMLGRITRNQGFNTKPYMD